MIKYLVYIPTGEFKEGGPLEPQRPILSVVNNITTYDPDYDVVVVTRLPDLRTEKWNGSDIVTRSQAELDAYDNTQKDLRADSIDMNAALQAIAQLDFEERQKLQVKVGLVLRTAAECKARLKSIYKSLL